MGTAILACRARRVTDEMLLVAGEALREISPALNDPSAALLPSLESLRQTARHIAVAVATEPQNQGLAEATSKADLERRIDQTMWLPAYVSRSRGE